MSLPNAYMALAGAIDGEVLRDERMSRHTTYRIGGPADLFVTCDSLPALTRCLEVLAEQRVPWVVLGRGSNVLVADEGYRGCVVCLRGSFCDVSVEGSLACAGAGMMLSRLVSTSISCELGGLEPFAGIPGSVGGAIAMNAGTRREWIGSLVRDLVVLRPGEGLRRLSGSEVSWGYRSTSLAVDDVVLEATLSLESRPKDDIVRDMERRLVRRRASQPLGEPSCGSVFRNPGGGMAVGSMIEGCGLKGLSVGGARVSPRHANFIVNEGGATASDVLELIRRVRDAVGEAYGVELETEVRFLGFSS